MSLLPKLGESRAMLSPGADRAMGLLANSDLLQLYLGQRAELYENCNLLERIPKTDGFFGIHLAWEQKIAALLSGPKSSVAAPGISWRFATCFSARAVHVGCANQLPANGHHWPKTGFSR